MNSKTSLCIYNARVVLPDRIENAWSVIVDSGRIAWVGPANQAAAPDVPMVDACGAYLSPGFIDLHIHGSGHWLADDGPDALVELSRFLPRYGVTGFVPAISPLPEGRDTGFLSELSSVQSSGAEILSFLLEGPYLAVSGALPPDVLGKGDAERVKRLIEAAHPYRAIFAVSPDFPGIEQILPHMTADGTPAFITHTRATATETRAAISSGARHATHFYDVFIAPPETDPGVRPAGSVEAILADPSVSVDFILDGEHVDPVVIQMALQCKTIDHVCLITDANRGAGLSPGRYLFGAHEVEFAYPGGPARFTADHPEIPGALAGSGLTMDTAVRNAVTMLGLELQDAVRMASLSPAHVLGLDDRKGRIEVGFDADLVLLDENLFPIKTWVSGVEMFADDTMG
ncbi:MAG: N-acetylglucosamine-6-phosphate deacetylase [Armatimonadota bacterium]